MRVLIFRQHKGVVLAGIIDIAEHELAKRYQLVIASNRDEILSRPADRLGRWRDNEKVIGGRDISGGGTWLGMSDGGSWSCILNVREPESAPETM